MKADWTWSQVTAALRDRGITIARLARESDYMNGVRMGYRGGRNPTLYAVATCHNPNGERIIATALGRTPREIWPSRYAGMVTEKRRKAA